MGSGRPAFVAGSASQSVVIIGQLFYFLRFTCIMEIISTWGVLVKNNMYKASGILQLFNCTNNTPCSYFISWTNFT